MATVHPSDVLTFLGAHAEGQDALQLTSVIEVATAMVKGFTRGRGFNPDPTEDLAAVIVSCAARLFRNPTLDRQQTAGPFTQHPGVFHGWTLAELAILHNYRVRAQ